MTESVWNILIATSQGNLSMTPNLTEDQARQAMQRLRWSGNKDPWSDEAIQIMLDKEWKEKQRPRLEKALAAAQAAGRDAEAQRLYFEIHGHYPHMMQSGMIYMSGAHSNQQTVYVEKDYITQAECWGPNGMELEVWPKPDDYEERVAKARLAYDVADAVNAEIDKAA